MWSQDAAPTIESRWNRHLRQAALKNETYACPYCEDRKVFAKDETLLQHVEGAHPEEIEKEEKDGELESFRQRLRSEARLRVSVSVLPNTLAEDDETPHRSSTAKPLSGHTPSKKPSGSVQRNDTSFHSNPQSAHKSRRPLSAGEIKSTSLSPTRELGDLSISQEPRLLAQNDLEPGLTDAPLSPLGSRKRAAGADTGSLDVAPSSRSPSSDVRANPRRSKARSGGPFPRSGPQSALNSEYSRQSTKLDSDEVTRPPSGRGNVLYNPSTDDRPSHANFGPSILSSKAPLRASFSSLDPVPPSLGESGLQRERKITAAGNRNPARGETDTSLQKNSNIGSSSGKEDKRGGLLSLPDPIMIPQPETRPISIEQLVAEVKGIYAGLLIIEARCIEVDAKEAFPLKDRGSKKPSKLSDETYQTYIALHRTLLYEHHDFFLASQHPSASPALRRLASKYSMPARMWRHGIHSFLELLRHRLPDSLDHMLAFIYLAYSMMALLYETVPTFIDTWVECLGDLARYRMAVEDDSPRDREIWTGVARMWYNRSADRNVSTGRLYHHLAILARPDALEQLYYYCRSLTCIHPFLSARESVMTLFEPVLKGSTSAYFRPTPLDTTFIKIHGRIFTATELQTIDGLLEQFLKLLDSHIGQVTMKWRTQGYFIAVSNIGALFEYGSPNSFLRAAYVAARPSSTNAGENDNKAQEQQLQTSAAQGPSVTPKDDAQEMAERTKQEEQDIRSQTTLVHGSKVMFSTFSLALERPGDENVMPHVRVTLIFLFSLTRVEPAMKHLEDAIPWHKLAFYLNALLSITINVLEKYDALSRICSPDFPHGDEKEVFRPLPEDFAIRGLLWCESFYPPGWFERTLVDEEERRDELASMADPRRESVLWLGVQIASVGSWLLFDKHSNTFSVGRNPTYSDPMIAV